jgi:hypothetical protein
LDYLIPIVTLSKSRAFRKKKVPSHCSPWCLTPRRISGSAPYWLIVPLLQNGRADLPHACQYYRHSMKPPVGCCLVFTTRFQEMVIDGIVSNFSQELFYTAKLAKELEHRFPPRSNLADSFSNSTGVIFASHLPNEILCL